MVIIVSPYLFLVILQLTEELEALRPEVRQLRFRVFELERLKEVYITENQELRKNQEEIRLIQLRKYLSYEIFSLLCMMTFFLHSFSISLS